MRMLGGDMWQEWNTMSQRERDAWLDALTEADRRHERRKLYGEQPTVKQALLDRQNKKRFIY